MSLSTGLKYLKNIAVTESDIFSKFDKGREEWEPQNIKNDKIFPYQDEINRCFSRCISLSLHLELPVGAFIKAALEQDNLPVSALPGLVRNIEDEEKHEKAFKAISQAYPVFADDMQQAKKYSKQICIENKTHPLIKSRDMETLIFICLQGVMRYYGSESLERIIGLISKDELRHLNYNWQVSEMTGIGFDYEFEDMLMGVNEWLFEPLKEAPLNQSFWMSAAQEMQECGKSTRLEGLFNYAIHLAPFEISNSYY